MPSPFLLVPIAAGAFVFWRARRRRALPAPADALHVTGVLHVNINCSDFDRSRAFYERLGFQVVMKVAPNGEGDVAAAVGLPRYTVHGALMAHKDGTTLDLLEWQEPRDVRAPYDNLHRPGIARIALTTSDLDADVAALKASGVHFLSERPGAVPDPFGGTTRFICFTDPDGTVLELVQMGTVMGWLQRATKLATKKAREG